MAYEQIKNIYFIGIGGIGMSALARYFRAQGKSVSGYDRNSSGIVKQLIAEDIDVISSDRVEDLPEPVLEDKSTLIVYTPAIPTDHKQYVHFVADGYRIEKRAVVLGNLTRGHFTCAVAGTHGKTTTSTMLAHLLKESGSGVTAFLGGISENYGTNLLLSGDQVMVVEADEFDRSFLQLSPDIAAITSMDADHLDVYGAEEEIKASFHAFSELVPEKGTLFFTHGLPLKGTSVGIEEEAEVRADNIRIHNGIYLFDLGLRDQLYPGFSLSLPGEHNLRNAVMALAMAVEFGVSPEKLAPALASFKGVKRRFTYRIRKEALVLIDDYAHHPAEISAVYQAVREMHPGKRVLVIFQPHLYSRTRDFAEGFAESLARFDEVLLMQIYAAREEPLTGITSNWLLQLIENDHKAVLDKKDLFQAVKNTSADVVVLLGAGDIGDEVDDLVKKLEVEY